MWRACVCVHVCVCMCYAMLCYAVQVPIVQHPDVKRMLLMQKAAVEGSMALGLLGCVLVDSLRVCDMRCCV